MGVYEWFTFSRQYTSVGSEWWHAVQGAFLYLGLFPWIQKGGWPRPVRMSHRVLVFGGVGNSFMRACCKAACAKGACISSPAWVVFPVPASDPATRFACLEMLRNLLSALPEHWSARLLPDYQPQLKVETGVALPITVTNLVTELTLFLLVLSPYLDLMDQAGVGLVATRPDQIDAES